MFPPGAKEAAVTAIDEVKTMEKLTAAQAIRRECKSCSGTTPKNCPTELCKLSPDVFPCRSSVKRIAAHCKDCSGENPPITCKGLLLRPNGNVRIEEYSLCWLHPFRLGRNPYKPKREPTPHQKAFGQRARGQKPALETRSTWG